MSCTNDERTLLRRMAERRADSVAWEQIAHELKVPVPTLHDLKDRFPKRWRHYLAEARREWLANVNQEAMMALLNIIEKGADDQSVLQAANVYAKLAQTQAKITTPEKPRRTKVNKPAMTPPPKEPASHNPPLDPKPDRGPLPTLSDRHDRPAPRPTLPEQRGSS